MSKGEKKSFVVFFPYIFEGHISQGFYLNHNVIIHNIPKIML